MKKNQESTLDLNQVNEVLMRVSGDLKTRLIAHQAKIASKGAARSIILKVAGNNNSWVTPQSWQSALTSFSITRPIASAAVLFSGDADYVLKIPLETISEICQISAVNFEQKLFAPSVSGSYLRLGQDTLIFMFSYILTFMSVAELAELTLEANKKLEQRRHINVERFLKFAEYCKSEDNADYPMSWAVNTIDWNV